jgi:oxygen-independent coproporphyrinogen III oxidase
MTGLYVHIPFCVAKCHYCDFCSFAGLAHLIPDYVMALGREAYLRSAAWQDISFDTIYLGGGTPTLLTAEQVGAILAACGKALDLSRVREATIEANPGTVSLEQLAALRRSGLDRISMGVQSLRNEELHLLGRIHSVEQAREAIRMARKAGFDQISLDLLFGLPRQTQAHWRETLEEALAQRVEHLSLYALTIEEGTHLAQAVARGALPHPDEGLVADMYTWAAQRLCDEGFVQYEISNWARADQPSRGGGSVIRNVCRHNLGYWRNARYLGLGVAAASFDGRTRLTNTHDVREYLTRSERGLGATLEQETLDEAGRMGETMMLGLRLVRGTSWRSFRRRFGVPMRSVYGDVIEQLCAQRLLEADARGIRLTERGRLLGNRVFAAFLP